MYQMILIDDEPITLRQLSTLYDWSALGFSLAGTFEDGEAAEEYIKKQHVDLVISDICMPLKDGLQLAEVCDKLFPQIQFIFISAHREFDYVQKALRFNVIYYLTKPINLSELEASVRKARETLDAMARNQDPGRDGLLYQQQVLSRLLRSTEFAPMEMRREFLTIGLSTYVLEQPCALFTVAFQGFSGFLNETWKYGLDQLYDALIPLFPLGMNLFCTMVRHSFHVVRFAVLNTGAADDFQPRVRLFAREFRQNMKNTLKLSAEYEDLSFFPEFDAMTASLQAEQPDYDAKAVVSKATDYMDAHYLENLSLEDVARYVALSPSYFSYYFKKETNQNFKDYRAELRCRKALEMLRDTDFPITTICELVGYKNVSHFYELIRSKTDMTPNEYRNRWQKKEP